MPGGAGRFLFMFTPSDETFALVLAGRQAVLGRRVCRMVMMRIAAGGIESGKHDALTAISRKPCSVFAAIVTQRRSLLRV
jgi:hypothetical protein